MSRLKKCYFNQNYHQKINIFLIKNTFYDQNGDFIIKKSYKKHTRIKVKQKNNHIIVWLSSFDS
ncbi:hypothetical protein BHS00_06960 [Lactococcus carnosus]|nr:hypothetical protein BHS00_06960 [Lactococcus carnosus]SCA91598.1 hypothetical protein LP2241_20369 [Lactococcus piscium]